VSDHRKSATLGWTALGVVWAIAVIGGMYVMLKYADTPAETGAPPVVWPAESRIPRKSGLPTVVVVAHPRCSCTRATISELAMLMTRLHNRATAVVVLEHPHGTPEHWEETDLWRSAAEIPGVTVMGDPDEVEADRFRAQASGQTMLYNADGRLLFSGGITASRGHAGDNAGRDSIISLVTDGGAEQTKTLVFGCALHNPASLSSNGEKR
jgi:hypothetical protein